MKYLSVSKKVLDIIGKSFWLFFGSKMATFAHHSPLLYVVKLLSPILGWAKDFFWEKGCSCGHLQEQSDFVVGCVILPVMTVHCPCIAWALQSVQTRSDMHVHRCVR